MTRKERELQKKIEDLERRLQEAEETLYAMRSGEVDAIVVNGPAGAQVYTLKGADEPYRVIMETMAEGSAVVDAHSSILYANRQLSTLLRIPLNRLIGSCFADLAWGENRGTLDAFLKESRAASRKKEFILAGSGEPVPVLLAATPLGGDYRETICLVVTDLSRLKEAESELRRANEALERKIGERTRDLVASNQELESYTYSVSHDLRSPLRAIVGFTRMILDDHGASFDPETRRKFGVIENNAEKMGRLIEDLLRLSRLSRVGLRYSTIDVERLVREILGEIGITETERSVELSIHDLPPLHGDPALIRQLMMNLLSNAVKFTRWEEKPMIQVGSMNKPDGRVYYVTDNGVGFDMKYHDKLFGVFQRLVSEKQFEGTGVGLAIAQRIVQRHGGRIWAEGKPQQGATFYFTLPEMKGS